MSAFLGSLSLFFIPTIFAVIIACGLWKRAPIYDYFIEGAREGLKTAMELVPFIVAIFIAIEIITSSGAMDFFQYILSPAFEAIGIPKELISLILLRPVSGSGSLVLAEQIMEGTGVDSLIGRSAAVMVGSCETVFYVLALYFGVTAVRKMRHAFFAGAVGYIVGVFASVIICSLIP